MSIQLVTYANQTVTPTNDAIIYEKAIDQNGIFYGCNVTVSSNEVHITGGYGIVCGREFTIQSESIAVTLAPSGTLDGRLYVRLDLADADAPIQLLTATGNTLPALEQDDDVNFTNGVYEMELATFTVGVSALSDVVETFETIIGTQNRRALLWTNASPSSSFAAQTVNIANIADYEVVEIDFVTVSPVVTLHKGEIGPRSCIEPAWQGIPNYRTATLSSGGVTFSDAYKNSSTVDNTLVKPYRIFGIKNA